MVAETARLISREADPPEYQRFLGGWHFSVTERRRLRELLRRRHLLGEDGWAEELDRLSHARAVLAWLERRLHSLPVRIGGGFS